MTLSDYVKVGIAFVILVSAMALIGGGGISTAPCDAGSVVALFSSCPRQGVGSTGAIPPTLHQGHAPGPERPPRAAMVIGN